MKGNIDYSERLHDLLLEQQSSEAESGFKFLVLLGFRLMVDVKREL